MNQKFSNIDYLKKEISEKKEKIESFKDEIFYLSNSIEGIEKSKAFRLWSIIRFLRSSLNKISPMIILKKIKKIVCAQQQKILGKKYITCLDDIKVTKNYKISVVIPTYCAEPFMPALLKAISAQKYIEDLDLIIIDSESKDKTQQMAKDFGATVLTIKQKEFTHSLARNIAAKHARHDLILFTVQDELPADNTTFAKMAELISTDESIAAVSTNQKARPDADLFARWQVDNHNKVLDLTYDSISKVNDFSSFNKESFILQRRVSLLDDVCALYRKNIFYELGGFTEVVFGEDLDFAFKALKSGFKLGLLCSSGVIHSHNRPANYFLKRTFISSMLDLDLLSVVNKQQVIDPTLELKSGMIISEYLIDSSFDFSKDSLNFFTSEFKAKNLREDDFESEVGKSIFSIIGKLDLMRQNASEKDVITYYQTLLNILGSYLTAHPDIIATDEDKKEFLDRMLATKIGDVLARHCLGKQTAAVKKNKKILTEMLFGNV